MVLLFGGWLGLNPHCCVGWQSTLHKLVAKLGAYLATKRLNLVVGC